MSLHLKEKFIKIKVKKFLTKELLSLSTHLSESLNLNLMMNLAESDHLDRDHKVLTVVLQEEFQNDPAYLDKGIFIYRIKTQKFFECFSLIIINC